MPVKYLRKKKNDVTKFFKLSTIMLFFIDALAISLAFFLALLIKHDLYVSYEIFRSFIIELPIVILIYWITFEVFQMYKSLWQFAEFEEIIKGIIANVIATISSYLVIMLIFDNHLSFGFYLTAVLIAIFTTLFIRLFYRVLRIFKKYFSYEGAAKRALIIGAGSAGVMVHKEIERNIDFDSITVGFVDDDSRKIDRTIHSVPVLGEINDCDLIIAEYNIDIVYVAIPRASKKRITTILNNVEKTGAKIKLFPPFYEMMMEKDSTVKLRDVKLEDLLGREEIILEEDGIREYIDGKTVVVTGGGGSIGSELCRQLRHFNPEKIIVIDIYENNAYDLQMEFERLYRSNKVKHQPEFIVLIASVRDEKRIDEIFNEYKPSVVFHAAAHKHVPLMEASPKEAVKNNVFGTLNVAKMADKHNVEKFVFISTDKAVNPTNVMGATKRIAEKIIVALNKTSKTDFAAVRFGNVLGSNGSVIPLFKKQIEEGGPLTVTHPEIIRYFMTIPEACQLVIQAGAYANGGEIFILDMGSPVKIFDLAEKMIRLSGFEPFVDIDIKFTGLRPGEKMFEELLVDPSKSNKTNNDKIFIENANNIDYSKFQVNLNNFYYDINEEFAVSKYLHLLVPSYIEAK